MNHPFLRYFLGSLFSLYIRNVKGKIPDNSNYIYAANHSSFVDAFVFPFTIFKITGKKFHIFVNSRFYKNFFFRKFLYHYHLIPVDLSKDVKNKNKRKKTNKAAFDMALFRLKKDFNFIIFPEGSRSLDGKLRKGKTGVAIVALKSKVPVIPVGILGSYKIMPRGAKFPKFKRADIVIGKPMNLKKYYGKTDTKTLQKVADLIMREIAKLTNQSYPY